MATVPCSKCTAERKGFRRELDSWRHKLIHCIGFESILEGIYGPLLLRDLSLFDDFEPEEVIDWSPQENSSHCSFCNLPLEKLNDHVLSSMSPLSSPSDYSPHHVSLSESSQSAHRFLQAVFNKKDLPLDCDSNIPLIAQELMKKMIRQFAMEYASKCLLHTTTNGVQTKTTSPQSETADSPLDLTVSRAQEEKEPQPDGVLDLSNRKSASLPTSKSSVSAVNHKASGRQQRQEYIERSLELSEGLLSKALKDIRSGRLQEQRAALLYGIPLQVLKQGHESWSEDGLLQHLSSGNGEAREEVSSYCVMSSMLGGEARLVLQKVAAWAERAEIGGAADENGDLSFPSSSLTFFQPNKTIPQSFPQLRDALQPPSSPTPSLEPPTPLRIPQVRSISDQSRSHPTENGGAAESLHFRTSSTEGTASVPVFSSAARPLFKLRPSALTHSSNLSPHRLGARASLDDMEEGADRRDKDKQPRKKRGRYRQYDHELMEEAITMVMGGRMSVSKAQGVYGVPHSTLEYKIKERTGTLKNPPKKKSAISCSSSTNVSGSGSTCSATSGILTSAAPTNSCSLSTTEQEKEEPQCHGTKNSALGAVLSSLCPAHQWLLFRILKLAHQRKLFVKSLKQVQPECYCCHYHGTKSDCTTHSCCQHWLIDHCSSRYHPGESKSNCSTNQCALKESGHGTDWDSSSCSAQLCKGETCTIICPNMVHCQSCQSFSSTNINSLVCSFAPTVPSSSALGLCSLSVCCSQHNSLPCSCHLRRPSLTEEKSTNFTENEGDNTALKKEQSPSPPPLSPIPDLNKQRDERPPVLHQIQDEEVEPVGKIRGNANLKKYLVKKQNCSQTKNTGGTFLQDVVSRFSEKLETIKPSEKEGSLVTAPEAEKQQLHCASKCVHLNSKAHLTEIITTVLHTGSSSEYNLGEFINYHNNKEPQSPNTRSRRRLAAMATPTEDATTPRQNLQIKRKLARLDQSHNNHKRAMLKNGESIFKQVDDKLEREVETVKLNSETPNKPKTGTVLSQLGNKKQEDDIIFSIKEEADVAVIKETPSSFQDDNWNLDEECNSSNCVKNVQSPLNQSTNSRRARKSKRNIVPPPRYSSYVTEPRKMYFVACFSDTVFNQRSQTEDVITPPQSPELNHENYSSERRNEYFLKAGSQIQGTPTTKNKRSPTKNDSDSLMDNKCVAKQRRRLDDVKEMPSACTYNPCLEYTSPIKLMFVSPVKDEEGVKYSLKSAATVNGSPADQCFDPCEESSWSGTPEKITRQLATQTASPLKSSSPPAKPASASRRSSPNKTSPKLSPAKSGSPKSNTSSPKVGTRRLCESSPSKRIAVDDTQRFSHDASSLHENTPPKRSRGRPKKLGPQLEKKVKRPIGRPRKEKVLESTVNEKVNGNTEASDTEKNVNKNLKITVLYGRSRRNKRMVSEGFDQLQTEFHDACQAVGLNKNWSMLMKTTKVNSTDQKAASVESSQKIPLIRPVKDCAPHSKSIIKCSSMDDAAPSRKPGRPAKIKISGISVTVTTVSPRQRKIQINKDKASPVKQHHKRALFQKPVSAKEHKTITCHSVSKSSDEEQHSEEPKREGEGEAEPNPPVAVRHSERVRKPSIHFLHAVATSSSYSCSNALVRRSKQLLLNKTKKDDSQNKLQPSGEKQHLREEGKGKASSLGLQQIATVSVDSVYRPKEMKWWLTSVQEKTLNQELARRIRLISDTWVSDTVGNESGLGADKSGSQSSQKPKCSSVVRSLFDCSPNKPRSCSMQQLRSWFMQTTETQSLSIVKKTSSRNPYEVMHFPRNTYKKTTCYSPQAERLRKHLKKFAKIMPKTPNDYAEAQKKVHRSNVVSKPTFKYWYSTNISATGRLNYTAKGRRKSFSNYKASLYRAKRRFLTRKERKTRVNKKTLHILNRRATGLHPKQKTLLQSAAKHFSFSGQPLDPVHVADHSCSEHSSPETMKECRVFLRKIYSPNNGAKEEEGSRTVTLDEGSPSELLLCRSEKGAGVNQAVKTEHISPKRDCFTDSESCSPELVQGRHLDPMKGRSHEDEVPSESPLQPPAKRLRQSRMTGLSGPRWRDFVFEN